MTKMYLTTAARQVKDIRDGAWTHQLPRWAREHDGVYLDTIEISSPERGNIDRDYTRAAWTAEAYILLFQSFNARFDVQRFLVACGLGE